MSKYFDPRSRSNEDLQRDVESGKIDDFKRTSVGGIQTYQTTSKGDTLIKDVEPVNNSKGHQQTNFTIRNGQIVDIRSHNDY